MLINGVNELEKVIRKLNLNKLNNTIILLNGDLGSGKTTFAKYLLKKVGVSQNVTSPTFNIVNQYKTNDLLINHIDAYRIKKNSPDEEMINELIENCFSIIEWSKNINVDMHNKKIININIEIIDEDKREFKIW